jgi:glycosyltransferase involved in cell wall biosynthesis
MGIIMLVSVIIPTYNSSAFIERSINSVLKQTYKHFELIISDDGSTDDTIYKVKSLLNGSSLQYKILKNTHRGPGYARNAAVLCARGAWIAFLDSDDEWLPYKLERVVAYISRNHKVDLLCHSEIIDDSGESKIINYSNMFNYNIPVFCSLYKVNALSTSAVLIKKSILQKVGMFDITLPSAQDYELWLKVSSFVKIAFIFSAFRISLQY